MLSIFYKDVIGLAKLAKVESIILEKMTKNILIVIVFPEFVISGKYS